LEQLLGKGAALSDHGSNPWEGEREREGEPKKGKGRGKGDTNPEAPKALEDMPPDEQQVECLKKLQKTRDLLQQCRTNYEEALEKVKGMQYLTKPAFKEKETQLSKLETALGKVKKQLAKR
jgi:molecular chaperone DnaK (HSP70)